MRIPSARHLMVTSVIGVFLSTSASAVELISNGGFEIGNFTPQGFPTYDTITSGGPQDLSSWTVGNSLVWGWNTTDINVYDGQGFVDLTGVGDTAPHGTLSQTLPTLVGQKYAFSVYTTLYDTVGINVSANGAPIILSGPYGTWDGTPTGAIWRQVTGAFIADGTSSTIVIAGQPGFSFMIGLDDVSVTGPALAAVPELSSWALMFLGFAGLGVVGYHRAKRASPRYTLASDSETT